MTKITKTTITSVTLFFTVLSMAIPINTAHALPSSPYTTFDPLAEGFTQEVYGVSSSFLGGVAFAPDGDPLVNHCFFSGSPLERFDTATTYTAFGTTLHTSTTLPSNAGCGMTNHPDGFIYTNTGSGVEKLDPNTGADLGYAGGSPGNALGITVDPQTGDIFYVSSSSNIIRLDPTTGTSSLFATVGGFIDGIFWNDDGSFLYIAQRSAAPVGVWEIDRTGAITQQIAIGHEPDGIAFHIASGDIFVNTTDGFIMRIDLDTLTPTVSVFASGGFRGDLSQVGTDGCMYLTQAGTRYDDGTTTFENSVVRVCGGFSTPPGVEECGNGIDDDGDGLVDEDCQVEICGNGIDDDGDGLVDEDCNLAPDCSAATTNITKLWPPNHKLKTVLIQGVTDPEGEPTTITITGISQDEPTNGVADGDKSPDGFVVGQSTAQVRSERAGTEDGRFYIIGFVADDGNGGTCSGTVQLPVVPHDKSPNKVSTNQGPLYDSTLP